MSKKSFTNFLLFALLGIAHWFFGNLYEGIVITPNLLSDSIGKIHHWQAFFKFTNPVFFYLPLTPIAALTTFVLYFKTANESTFLKRHLAYASVFLIFALGLGIFIITQINFKLFFGNIERFSADIYYLSVLWNILNLVRVILLAFTIYHLFKAYIFIKTETH
jgi:hypothetical protein